MFGEEISRRLSLPSQHHMFTMNDESEKLDENSSNFFNSVKTSLLYIMKSSRQDIELLLSFLSTWL